LSTETRPSLLEFVNQQAFDADYRAADALDSVGAASLPWLRTGLAIGAAMVLGGLGVIAVQQNERSVQVRQSETAVLIQKIEVRRDAVAAQNERLAQLEIDTRQLERDLDSLSTQRENIEERRRALAIDAALVSASGPGMLMRVSDGEGSGGRVRDEDVALLVDGLWHSGASAIAINGQRLTALSAIRNSGSAIHVNGVPLSPPYTISALGDPDMAAELLASEPGARWYSLVDLVGIGFELDVLDQLTVPAGSAPHLRFVEVASAKDGGV
jgi:uncharacterized protein YlxW (UPF0749 family)